MGLTELVDGIGEGIAETGRFFKNLILETPVEIAIGAAIGAIWFGNYEYGKQLENQGRIPLVFSEISQLEDCAKADGQTLTPINVFLPKVNYMSMKIFECSNASHEGNQHGKHYDDFAAELSKRIHPEQLGEKRHRRELKELLDELPQDSQNTINQFSDTLKLNHLACSTVDHLNKAWNYSTYDHYHTEVHLVPVVTIDSDGNSSTHLEPRVVSVYDYTTHTFKYNGAEGEEAAKVLNQIAKEVPQIGFDGKLFLPSKVGKTNLDTIEKTREKKKKEPEITEADARKKVWDWWYGSTINQNLPEIRGGLQRVIQDASLWSQYKSSAKSQSYNTHCGRDNGPAEYQVAQRALDGVVDLGNKTCPFLDGIAYVMNNAPILKQKILALETPEAKLWDKKTKKKNMDEIVNIARECYKKNIPNGLDVDRFSYGMIFLFTLLGSIAGAGVGAGVDFGINKLKEKYEEYKRYQQSFGGRYRRR
jgi:hypothetical protein